MDDLKGRICSYVEAHREEMVHFLRKLVRIDTQVPPGRNYDTIYEVLAEKLRSLGCEVRVYNATEKYLKLQGAEIYLKILTIGTDIPECIIMDVRGIRRFTIP